MSESHEIKPTSGEGDLIDLNGSSSVIQEALATYILETRDSGSDNLIDTDLPFLEQKLQTASGSGNCNNINSCTVDIEDILIKIEDDNANTASEIDLQGNSNSDFLNKSFPLQLPKTCSYDNLEALEILRNLDEVLNFSLSDGCEQCSSEDSEESSGDLAQAQRYIEDCLLDLDNYLKNCDSSNCEDPTDRSFQETNNTSSGSSSLQDLSEQVISENDSCISDSNNDKDDESLRKKLRQIEKNYLKFLASGCINRAYMCTESDLVESEVNNRRPLSACGERNEALCRNQLGRATISVVSKERPEVQRVVTCTSSDPNAASIAPGRTSGTPGDSDEDIDWSWVQDVARDVNQERLAHAATDCCTGSVVVEPLHRHATSMGSSLDPQEAKEDQQAGMWLRNSMRRLRHFVLPNEVNETLANEPLQTLEPSAPPLVLITEAPDMRPVSAPSRLPVPGNENILSVSDRTSNRSRSRSRESFQSAVSHLPGGRARSRSNSSRSRRRRSLSSSDSSVVSSVDTSTSCTPAPTPDHTPEQATNIDARRSCERSRHSDMPEAESPLGQWPHSFSSMMACLGCTLGLFNISRFAILSIHFGANFILQFLFLTLVFGLPLFTLQLCLGQQLGAGVIDMWRISPLFQGVGVSLLIAHMFIGLYSIIGVSWMFVYFRDSFITKMDRYRWAEPFTFYRTEVHVPINGTYKLSETVPDYFSGIVLQRHHLPSGTMYSTIKFQSAFNLAVVWMIVFVSLSKGLRSYGKVVYVFTLLPVCGIFVICAKILGMMPQDFINVIFPQTSWDEFFLNSKSWLAAAQETFLTWGLLGAAIMQIASHNKHKHLLQRDSSLIAIITIIVLLLVAFLANTCVQILRFYGYHYTPNSFENMSSYIFLRSVRDPLPPNLANTPVRYMVHNSFILGEKVIKPGTDLSSESGYQALRLLTELVPSTFAVIGSDLMSPFWAVLFYFVFILFGISQQLAIWHCIITGIMAIKANMLKSWETTITFFSCACGFILGLPMATELGIYVVYFMDYIIGGIWWLVFVILLQILAVFMVRGRPYSGDTVVTALFTPNSHPCLLSWAPALLSFTWNVILPVALVVLCITTFKNGNFREIFVWHHAPAAEYWPLWARQAGSVMQLIPILCIPVVAFIQSYRYLNNGPDDILERIQLLYRPPIGEHMEEVRLPEPVPNNINNNNASTITTIQIEDPPPKYTPPPSYTTATGARIAKFLRQSIRRSMRRIANALGEGSNISRQPSAPPPEAESEPPPPNYNDVLVEMNQRPSDLNNDIYITVPESPVSPSRRLSTLERLRSLRPSNAVLTAAEVACILRNSFRRSTIRPNRNIQIENFPDNSIASLSAENLIESAAPIGETSLILDQSPLSGNEIKPENDSNTSVI